MKRWDLKNTGELSRSVVKGISIFIWYVIGIPISGVYIAVISIYVLVAALFSAISPRLTRESADRLAESIAFFTQTKNKISMAIDNPVEFSDSEPQRLKVVVAVITLIIVAFFAIKLFLILV